MKSLLIEISQKATKYEDFNFTVEQIEKEWLGNIPATVKEISDTEVRLDVKLPEDYIEFLKITNGFSAPNVVEPSFEKIQEVEYLKNVDKFIIDAYGLVELQEAIVVGGNSAEQYFLLLPPNTKNDKWKYWKFANWIPGEHPFENLTEYFESVLEFITNEHEN